MKFHIYAKSGADFGIWDGASPAEAWARMVSEAGYSTDPIRIPGTTGSFDIDTVGSIDDWDIEIEDV